MISNWPVVRIETEKRRLVILQFLTLSTGYEAQADVLRDYCCRFGVPTTDDAARAALHWLQDALLATLREADDTIIARITVEGIEVAQGLRKHPGVMTPGP